jgi:dUTP pyrophosphatase
MASQHQQWLDIQAAASLYGEIFWIPTDETYRAPERAEGNAGYDIFSPIDDFVAAGETRELLLPLRVAFSDRYVLKIHERSSSIFKLNMKLALRVGIVDSGYRGLLKIRVINAGDQTLQLTRNQTAIAQGIFTLLAPSKAKTVFISAPPPEGLTARGQGGFGSTGNLASFA